MKKAKRHPIQVDFSGVPSPSRVEYICRTAGGIPKIRKWRDKKTGEMKRAPNPQRKRWHDKVIALIDDPSTTIGGRKHINVYLRGGYDRRRKDGRPPKLAEQFALSRIAAIVEDIRREEKCSKETAINLAVERSNYSELKHTALQEKLKNYIRRSKNTK
jgi:hypothetical protein